MAPFAYHISRPIRDLVDGEFKHEIMSEFGLTHLGVKKPGTDCFVTSTKEGGTLISFDKSMSEKNIQQTWLEVREGLSIGWMQSRKPTPIDLAKPKFLKGMSVVDLSGSSWVVPVINSGSQVCSIPQAITYQGGTPVKSFLPGYRDLWEFAGELFEQVIETVQFDDFWVTEKALQVLGINYRISPIEVEAFASFDHLIFSQPLALAVLLHSLDFQLVEDAVKKKLAGD